MPETVHIAQQNVGASADVEGITPDITLDIQTALSALQLNAASEIQDVPLHKNIGGKKAIEQSIPGFRGVWQIHI